MKIKSYTEAEIKAMDEHRLRREIAKLREMIGKLTDKRNAQLKRHQAKMVKQHKIIQFAASASYNELEALSYSVAQKLNLEFSRALLLTMADISEIEVALALFMKAYYKFYPKYSRDERDRLGHFLLEQERAARISHLASHCEAE